MPAGHYIIDLNKRLSSKDDGQKKRPTNCWTLLLSLLDLNQGPSD